VETNFFRPKQELLRLLNGLQIVTFAPGTVGLTVPQVRRGFVREGLCLRFLPTTLIGEKSFFSVEREDRELYFFLVVI